MPTQTFTQVLGTTRSWQLTARANQQPVTSFVGGDALSARVFSGDGQPTLLTPTVAWITPSAGTIRLTITAAQLASAGVTPGIYRVQVFVTPTSDSEPRAVHDGRIEFAATSGSASAPTVYVSASELLDYAPTLESIQDKEHDLEGFADQRHLARRETDRRILNAYRPAPGRSWRYVNSDGSAPGPYLRMVDSGPGGATAPDNATLKGYLDAGALDINQDIAEFNARWAAALVYEAQIQAGTMVTNPYAELAKLNRTMAEQAWNDAVIELATTGGAVDARVGRDWTWLT